MSMSQEETLSHLGYDRLFHTAVTAPPPHLLSQLGQDWWYVANHLRFLAPKSQEGGLYIDLAANDAIVISNTYWLDACRGWRGLCVEANPQHQARLRSERTCTVDTHCIAEEPNKQVTFTISSRAGDALTGNGAHCGKPTPTERARHATQRVMKCSTLPDAAASAGFKKFDLLSLDVDGSDLAALEGWLVRNNRSHELSIDVIIAEDSQRVGPLLRNWGYRELKVSSMPLVGDRAYVRHGFRLGIERAGGRARPAACTGAWGPHSVHTHGSLRHHRYDG